MPRPPVAVAILIAGLIGPPPIFAAESDPEVAENAMQTPHPAALEGTLWRLETYRRDGEDRPPISGRHATLQLEDGRIGGSGGCNRFSGSYTLDRDRLAFGAIAATRMACRKPDGVMEQESGLLRALEAVAEYRIEGDELTLLDGDGKVMAKFQAAE